MSWCVNLTRRSRCNSSSLSKATRRRDVCARVTTLCPYGVTVRVGLYRRDSLGQIPQLCAVTVAFYRSLAPLAPLWCYGGLVPAPFHQYRIFAPVWYLALHGYGSLPLVAFPSCPAAEGQGGVPGERARAKLKNFPGKSMRGAEAGLGICRQPISWPIIG